MRILQIVPSLDPETGGPSKSVPMLCKALAGAGHEVELYTTDWTPRGVNPGIASDIPVASGYRVRVFPSTERWLGIRLPSSAALIRAVRENCRKYDLVDCHSLWNPVATFAMKALREAGMLYCVTPRGMLDPVVFGRNPWRKFLWALLYERANVKGAALIRFTATAEEAKARKCGWRLPKTVIFPNLIDLAEWRNLPPREYFESIYPQVRGREVVLFVGRINWVKNLDKLVEGMAIVLQRRPSAMLVCVGPDSDGYKAKLEAQACTLGIGSHVLFTGMLQGSVLKAAYARANTFALVSQKENFGLAAAEALACGLPVVLSEGVDLGKDLPPNKAVRCVSPDPVSIAEALLATLEETFAQGLPNVDALKLAEREWGLSSVQKLVDAYAQVLTSRH